MQALQWGVSHPGFMDALVALTPMARTAPWSIAVNEATRRALMLDPAFKDGAFTSADARVRAYALQKTMLSMDLGHELGATTYVFWGGREGTEVDASGKLEGISLGSLKGDAQLPGDAMAFANLPPAISVDGKAFARLAGPVTRLAGASVAQGLEVAPTGVILLRADGAIYQLLPVQPIAIDATQPDGLAFTPLGLLRWVRGGVVVQFAPAVADLAGLATAVAAKWPEAKIKLMAEGVLRLSLGGQTHVLRPEWTGAGSTTTGTPQVELEEGSLRFGAGNGPVQWLLPALLSHTQAHRARGPSPSPWPARCGAWCRRGCCQRRPVARHRRPMKTGGQEAMECCTCGWGPGAGRARYRLRGLREAWSGGRALAVTERCWSVS